ncbi:MAG: dephospho-CoA kinase [Alphaproteobacteria bacterium]
MIVLGLTGSIGMGKSTAAAMLQSLGVAVCDSDRLVHDLLGRGGGAVGPIERAFPGIVRDGAVDRKALGEKVFGDDAALRRLEAILHPVVHQAQVDFIKRAAIRGQTLVALDVPLLFEVGTDARCDAIIVVTAPQFLQEARVLGRAGMTRTRLDDVLARQMPDLEKRRRADFVVQTGIGRRHTLKRLSDIVTMLRRQRGRKWPPGGRGRLVRGGWKLR